MGEFVQALCCLIPILVLAGIFFWLGTIGTRQYNAVCDIIDKVSQDVHGE